MIQKKLFDFLLKKMSLITKKKVLYIGTSYLEPTNLAVKSIYGFWYCGNVFDQEDIAYGIASHGTVETFDTEIVTNILKTLPENYTFYDIGANTGWYTMVSLSLQRNSTVHAFEPIAKHCLCLKETILLNKKEHRATIHQIALSDTSGTSEMLLAGSGSTLEKTFIRSHVGKELVALEKLDTYINSKKIKLPDFIKIDVEGHEYKVLKGSEATLRISRPILFIEIAYTLKKLHRNFTNSDYEAIFKLTESLNYKSFIVNEKGVAQYFPRMKSDGIAMYLFLHKEKHADLILKYSK